MQAYLSRGGFRPRMTGKVEKMEKMEKVEEVEKMEKVVKGVFFFGSAVEGENSHVSE